MHRSLSQRLLAPVFTSCLLAGAGAEKLSFHPAADAAPYHQRVREAAAQVPTRCGPWEAKDVPVPYEAVQMLRPNVMICRRYQNLADGRAALLLVVQCEDARMLDGHYPAMCYPHDGYSQIAVEPRDWQVGGLTVTGMQYEFALRRSDRSSYLFVSNFLLLPGGRTVRDMESLEDVVMDVRTRYYGAAEIQIVFDPYSRPSERDDITKTLIAATLPLIRAIGSAPVAR